MNSRQFEIKRRPRRPRRELAVRKRRIGLCLPSTPFGRCCCFYESAFSSENLGSIIMSIIQPSIVAAEDGSKDLVTADVILPSSKVHPSWLCNIIHCECWNQVYLPPRDDAAEFDDGGVDLAGHQDDREVVQWRKSNKVPWILTIHSLLLTLLWDMPCYGTLSGRAAAWCDSSRRRQGGGRVRDTVPVHQHSLRSRY